MKIETNRLLIREVIHSDDEAIYNAAKCPQVSMMHSNEFTSLENVQKYIQLLIEEYEGKKYRTMAVAEKTSNTLIGLLTLDIDIFFPRAEVSYWIDGSHRNAGYATEAVKGILAYCFDDLSLNRIQAMHFPDNLASGRVLIKAGMQYEGTLRQYIGMGEMHLDCLMYAIVKQDYLTQNQ